MDKKEAARQRAKKHYYENREYKNIQNQEWAEKNRDKSNQIKSDYCKRNPENRTKSYRIYQWKVRGIIFHDYDLLYDIYLQTTHCDRCDRLLTMDNGSAQKCLDHDHTITDDINVRNILCKKCNNFDVWKTRG